MAGTFDIASQSNAGVVNTQSYDASISADGNLVSFVSLDPVSGFSQAYVKNESNSVLTPVSQSSAGVTGNQLAYYPTLSADGSSVGFDSYASNLVAGATAGNDEVYVKNLSTGGLTLVSQTGAGTVADGQSEYAALSANGAIVAFDSNATNLGLGASGAFKEIYVKNLATGAFTLASQTATGTQANGDSYSYSISADGNVVVFGSLATDLGSASGLAEIYAKNIQSGALSIVSQTSGGTIANAGSYNGSTSADGTLVAFDSTASNLVAGATGGNSEAYLKNLATGGLTLISAKADGTIANGVSDAPILSADGRFALFESTATNLDPAATAGLSQVYVKNLQTGALTLLSKDASGAAGNAGSYINYPSEQAFSAGDSRVAFSTYAANLAGPLGAEAVVRDTVDIVPPTVAFTPGVTFHNAHTAKLTGTVADASGQVTGVEVYDNGTDLGAAVVHPNGTWTLAQAHLTTGQQNLTATATDAAGNVSQQTPASFGLQTGIHGQPYTSYEQDLNPDGSFAGETFTAAKGAVYLNDYSLPQPNGTVLLNYDSGTYFNDKSFYYKSDTYSSDFSVEKSETVYNNDGSHTVTGFANSLKLASVFDDTMTGNGKNESFVFQRHFGQDTITDFIAGNGPGHDLLSLSTAQFTSAAEVLNNTKDVNGNAVIQVGAHNTITLDNVSTASLTASDFKFHA